MAKQFLVFLLIITSFNSCKKDNDHYVYGQVIQQGGCFGTSYLVAIEQPDFSLHPFLRPSLQSCAPCFNCSNAAYIRLTTETAIPGVRIRFKYLSTVASCLSASEAPPHIDVKNLSRE